MYFIRIYCIYIANTVSSHNKSFIMLLNPFPSKLVLRALTDFTLSNARRFYSSMGNLLDRKGLKPRFLYAGYYCNLKLTKGDWIIK